MYTKRNSDTLSAFTNTSFASEWGGLLYEVSRQFASTLELDDVLSTVLNLTVRSVRASQGSIFLLDDEGHITRSLLSRGVLPVEVKRHKFAEVMRDGLAGWVYTHQKADIIFDTEADDRWHIVPGDTSSTRSAMAVPLMQRGKGGKVIGVITLTHLKPNVFTPRHLMLIEVIATQAAAAIENAAIYTDVNLERLKLQAIIEGVQDVIFVTDLDDCLILANPAAQIQLGVDAMVYGQSIRSVINDPTLVEGYERMLVGECEHKEITLKDERTFNASLVRIPNLGNVITMHDVTAFKRLDELKSQFVSHVSHDLKAPLAIVQGYAWLLNNAPELNKETRGYAAHILNSVERMLGLISNLLDLGRIEMGIESEFKNFNLVDVVRNALLHSAPLAEKKKVALSLDVAQEKLFVLGSELRLEQAVINLLGNAIKFTPTDGKVNVWVGSQGRQAIVRVQDSGPGIPAAMQASLFQKFSRLGQQNTLSQEGHGLGLAIVKSIVDAHNGQVWVESEVDEGSMFAFSLLEEDPLPVTE